MLRNSQSFKLLTSLRKMDVLFFFKKKRKPDPRTFFSSFHFFRALLASRTKNVTSMLGSDFHCHYSSKVYKLGLRSSILECLTSKQLSILLKMSKSYLPNFDVSKYFRQKLNKQTKKKDLFLENAMKNIILR